MEPERRDGRPTVTGNAVISSDQDWTIRCSDDEAGSFKSSSGAHWEPRPSEIIQMYQILESKGVLDLEWQCPGRRSPSMHSNESESTDKRPLEDDENSKQSEPNQFDFDDEVASQICTPKITPRRRVTPANSAQKRVARFEKVMFDIERYRKLDELELQKVGSSKVNVLNRHVVGGLPNISTSAAEENNS